MRHGIDLDSAEYAGRKSSRQAVFGSDALPDEQNGRDSEPESGSQPLDDADSGSGDASDMSGPSEDAVEDEDALEGTSDGEEAEDDGEDVAEASEEEADLSAAAALTGTVDEEMRALEAEYDAAAAADAQAAAGLAQRAAKERLKVRGRLQQANLGAVSRKAWTALRALRGVPPTVLSSTSTKMNVERPADVVMCLM
jgi:protein AATF/BFR2